MTIANELKKKKALSLTIFWVEQKSKKATNLILGPMEKYYKIILIGNH